MGIGFRELLIILVIALILFGAKKLRNVGSDLGAAVRGFKKAVNEGDDEATKQLNDMSSKDKDKDADFKERSETKSDSKPAA
jgi:sec-independent protein translocase protein TatA